GPITETVPHIVAMTCAQIAIIPKKSASDVSAAASSAMARNMCFPLRTKREHSSVYVPSQPEILIAPSPQALIRSSRAGSRKGDRWLCVGVSGRSGWRRRQHEMRDPQCNQGDDNDQADDIVSVQIAHLFSSPAEFRQTP